MGLSFLAPLFLVGLAALAIPVLIHLRRRHERREMDFPSLMFLRDIPFRSERRHRIQNRLLLALRILALALLVAAFARPLFEGDGTATAGVVGPREVVLLVDRSWSMAHGDRWEAATEAADDELAALGPRDRVTLVLFDEGAEAPIRSSPEGGRARRLLQAAEPGDRSTRIEPALRLARSVLETSRLPRREVVLVTDFQASSWSGESDVSLPLGVAFRPVDVGAEEDGWTNATVASVALRRTEANGRDAVAPTARILRRGADGGASTVAVLEVDGRERERVDLRLEEGATEVEFGPVPLPERPVRAVVRLEADELPPDDVHRFVLSPGRSISVLVLEPPRTRDNASLYLRRGLELSRDPQIRVDVSSEGWPDDAPDRYDVVILNDRGVDGAEPDLAAFLSAGGGLFWAPGAGSDVTSAPLDTLVTPAGEARDHVRGGELRLGSVDRDHPIFQPFQQSGTGNFAGARFFRTRSLRAADSARVVARFDDGSPALLEARAGSGRILAWASTLHTFWTDLPLQPVFVPFLHRSVVHLADRGEATPAYRVGSVLAAGTGVRDDEAWSAVRTPEGALLELDDPEAPLVLEEAGFYELLETAEDDAGTPVAVNVDPREGDLARRDVEEVAAAVSPAPPETETGSATGASTTRVQAEDRERHQGLWRFLLVGTLLFLVGETAVSNRVSRAAS